METKKIENFEDFLHSIYCAHTSTDELIEQLYNTKMELQKTRTAVRRAIDTASHRWSEWGERAESVAKILDEIIWPTKK